MKKSQMFEIEEAIRLLVESAEKLYYSSGYTTYGRSLYELAGEIQEQLDSEELE